MKGQNKFEVVIDTSNMKNGLCVAPPRKGKSAAPEMVRVVDAPCAAASPSREIEIAATMRVPVKVRMTILDAADEAAFVDKCMAQPGNCDNDLSDSENREWFAKLWREQVRFQQLLLADPEHMAKYLAFVASEEIEYHNLLGKAVGDLENVVFAAADELDAVEHFDPPASYGVGCRDLLAQVLEGTKVTIEQPAVDIEAGRS